MDNGCRKCVCEKCVHCITIRAEGYLRIIIDCDVFGNEKLECSYCRYFLTKKEAEKVKALIESQKKV